MDEADERQVPGRVRQRVLHLGQRGERWLADLPEVIADLERAWSITVGHTLTGGTASYVARARTAEDDDAILKVAIPEVGFADELRVLAAAQGHGYVRLLAHDIKREAMLLEALGPPMASGALPPEQQIALLCRMLRQAWQAPRTAGLVLVPQEEKAGQLAGMVSRTWGDLGHPCAEPVVTRALLYAERRAAAFDLERCVAVHGDPHPWNELQVRAPRVGAEAGFVFVDPVGFLADAAYDLGVVLRDRCEQLLAARPAGAAARARGYCALLSAQTGVDETAIWEWAFLERVSSGLYCLELGLEEMAVPPDRRDAPLRLPARQVEAGARGGEARGLAYFISPFANRPQIPRGKLPLVRGSQHSASWPTTRGPTAAVVQHRNREKSKSGGR